MLNGTSGSDIKAPYTIMYESNKLYMPVFPLQFVFPF